MNTSSISSSSSNNNIDNNLDLSLSSGIENKMTREKVSPDIGAEVHKMMGNIGVFVNTTI